MQLAGHRSHRPILPTCAPHEAADAPAIACGGAALCGHVLRTQQLRGEPLLVLSASIVVALLMRQAVPASRISKHAGNAEYASATPKSSQRHKRSVSRFRIALTSSGWSSSAKFPASRLARSATIIGPRTRSEPSRFRCKIMPTTDFTPDENGVQTRSRFPVSACVTRRGAPPTTWR